MSATIFYVFGWLIAIGVVATYCAVTGFMVFATYVTKFYEHEHKLLPGWKISMTVAILFGALGDITYNAIVGTWRYRELPRELTYSGRVRRHFKKHDQSDWRCLRAQEDADLLNTILAGHVKP